MTINLAFTLILSGRLLRYINWFSEVLKLSPQSLWIYICQMVENLFVFWGGTPMHPAVIVPNAILACMTPLYWFNWPFYFPYFLSLFLPWVRSKYSYSPLLIGLTSVDPVRGGHKIKRFSQHEIVADLMNQQHKLCILNSKTEVRKESSQSEDDGVTGGLLQGEY